MNFFHRSRVVAILLCVTLVTLLGTLGGLRAHPAFGEGDGSWATYLDGNARTGYNGAESTINTTSAPDLKLKWTATSSGCLNSPGGPISISAEPVVVQSLQMIFWGSWDGCEHATDLNGNQLWTTYLGQTNLPGCSGTTTLGVASSPTIITETVGGVSTTVVLVGGGDSNFYALNAQTGAVIWKTQLGFATGKLIGVLSRVQRERVRRPGIPG